MNEELFARHGQLISERWPTLWPRLLAQDVTHLQVELTEGLGSTLSVDGIQLTSRHDRVKEAELQATSLPEEPVLHIYGTGLGDLPRVLLQRSSLRRLEVKIMNGALFVLVLRLLEQDDWLADPRVVLTMAGDDQEIRLPFFALPAELLLVDDAAVRIRDRLISEINLPFVNRRFKADDPERQARLESNRELLTHDADVTKLFGSRLDCTALIIATGPTLARHLPYLGGLAKLPTRPLIICVDTAYKTLLAHHIKPDLVVTIDHLIGQDRLPAHGSEEVKLVYFPMLPHETLAAWQGPRYGAYSMSQTYEALRTSLPRGVLHSGGSVIHPAVDLAVKMGANNVILMGVDFAFPGNQTHTGWQDGSLGPSAHTARHWVHDGHGNRVTTTLNFAGYLCELERYIDRHPEVRFWNTCKDGAHIQGCHYHPEITQ
ncbi:motility associated factor glycosyltransferase family protein [Aeromonas enteropelogenes]|uniref:motility associated factor glycosyltransferase family protein n=1 Tax=Aeromonas enteropelogenes TaxID=29489 RepID=UPI003BA33D26